MRQAEAEFSIVLRNLVDCSGEALLESRGFVDAGDCVLGHTSADLENFRPHQAEIARMS